MNEHWKDEPDEHDYPAALDYLTLVTDDKAADRIVAALRSVGLVHRKAKDILRASRLALLPADNAHVAKDLGKVKAGKALSPILLARTRTNPELAPTTDLVIADGYHRVCASYHIDENADIPCKLV